MKRCKIIFLFLWHTWPVREQQLAQLQIKQLTSLVRSMFGGVSCHVGLDARAAGIVMKSVKNTVRTGRTVVCTIHQPSLEIFRVSVMTHYQRYYHVCGVCIMVFTGPCANLHGRLYR